MRITQETMTENDRNGRIRKMVADPDAKLVGANVQAVLACADSGCTSNLAVDTAEWVADPGTRRRTTITFELAGESGAIIAPHSIADFTKVVTDPSKFVAYVIRMLDTYVFDSEVSATPYIAPGHLATVWEKQGGAPDLTINCGQDESSCMQIRWEGEDRVGRVNVQYSELTYFLKLYQPSVLATFTGEEIVGDIDHLIMILDVHWASQGTTREQWVNKSTAEHPGEGCYGDRPPGWALRRLYAAVSANAGAVAIK